jgi:uncharacterized membrane protein YccC
MLVLGLLLVVLSVGAVALLAAYNSSGGTEQMIVLFGRDLGSVNHLQAFFGGIVVALVFCLGLWMVVTTERRRRVVRSEYRAVRREARSAVAERDKLAEELAQERAAAEERAATTPEPATSTGTWRRPRHQEPVVDRDAETTTTAETPASTETRGIGRHFRRPRRAERTEETVDEQATTTTRGD